MMPEIKMPKDVSIEEYAIVKMICNKGNLRATKPPLKDRQWRQAAYVWRMVCFIVSPKPVHHHMPVCAFFELDKADTDGMKAAPWLEALIDKVLDTIPGHLYHGASRWSGLI